MITVHHLNNSRSQRVLWLLEELGLEYRIEAYQRDAQTMLAPAIDSPERLRYRYWLHYAEGSAMPPLLLKLVFDKIESSKMPFFAKPIAKAIAQKASEGFIQPQINTHLDFMEAELGKSRWFAGDDFSGADIQMSFPLEAAAARAGLNASRPRLMAFLGRIHDRPAYQRALERGGPYALMG